jgi:MFS family permease
VITALRNNARLRQGLGNFVLVFMSVGIVILYSSYQRPLWTDELQHFYLYGSSNYPRSEAALLEGSLGIVAPVLDGQAAAWYSSSWFYMLVNFLSLDVSGASSVALRLPSLISGALICLFAAWFLRNQKLSFIWQLAALLALAAQSYAMYFVGEARPYIPLAATVLGTALYFSVQPNRRRIWPVAVTGWVCVIFGVLNHAYFVGYAIAFALFFYFAGIYTARQAPTWRELWRSSSPVMVSVAIALAVLIRVPSSLRVPRLEYEDQWVYMRANGGFLRVFSDNHLQFLPLPQNVAVLFVIGALGTVLALFILSLWRYRELASLVVPAAFVLLSLALSAGISLGSLIGGYEILNRQWIASLVLVPVGAMWVFGNAAILLKSVNEWLSTILTVVVVVVLTAMSFYRLTGQIDALQNYSEIAQDYRTKWSGTTAEDASILFEEIGWETANVNIYLGGPVWSVTSQ